MSDLVGNPEDRFSHNEAHLSIMQRLSLVPETQCQSSLSELLTDEENITGLRSSSLEISILLQFVQGYSKCDIYW